MPENFDDSIDPLLEQRRAIQKKIDFLKERAVLRNGNMLSMLMATEKFMQKKHTKENLDRIARILGALEGLGE